MYKYSLIVKGGLDKASAHMGDHGITVWQKATPVHGEYSTQTVFIIHSETDLTIQLNKWFGEDVDKWQVGYGFPDGSLLMWSNLEEEYDESGDDRSCDRGDA